MYGTWGLAGSGCSLIVVSTSLRKKLCVADSMAISLNRLFVRHSHSRRWKLFNFFYLSWIFIKRQNCFFFLVSKKCFSFFLSISLVFLWIIYYFYVYVFLFCRNRNVFRVRQFQLSPSIIRERTFALRIEIIQFFLYFLRNLLSILI